jgi:hypothetical protein
MLSFPDDITERFALPSAVLRRRVKRHQKASQMMRPSRTPPWGATARPEANRAGVSIETALHPARPHAHTPSRKQRMNSNENGIFNAKGSTTAGFAPFSHKPGLD